MHYVFVINLPYHLSPTKLYTMTALFSAVQWRQASFVCVSMCVYYVCMNAFVCVVLKLFIFVCVSAFASVTSSLLQHCRTGGELEGKDLK